MESLFWWHDDGLSRADFGAQLAAWSALIGLEDEHFGVFWIPPEDVVRAYTEAGTTAITLFLKDRRKPGMVFFAGISPEMLLSPFFSSLQITAIFSDEGLFVFRYSRSGNIVVFSDLRE